MAAFRAVHSCWVWVGGGLMGSRMRPQGVWLGQLHGGQSSWVFSVALLSFLWAPDSPRSPFRGH